MSKKIGDPEKIKRKSSAGAFWGGTFLGFILGIGAIVGLGAFAYFRVSAAWINKNFKTDINLGSEELNKKTISDVVSAAVGLMEGINNYSLDKLNSDFGIEVNNKVAGIDISDLKSVPLNKLADAVKDKFSNISAKELEEVFTSNDIDKIMNKTITYYYDGEKLYKNFDDTTYSNAVTFDYKIVDGNLKIKNFDLIYINGNEVEVTLKYLPITTAIGDFTANLGNNLTLKELDEQYGVKLPDYIYVGNEDKTVNQVQEIINGVQLLKILNLTKDGDVYKDAEGNEMPYVINALAETTVEALPGKFKSLTVADLFKNSTSGVLSLVPATTTIDQLPSVIEAEVNDSTMGELKEAGLITVDVNKQIDTNNDGNNDTNLADMKINNFLNVAIALLSK